MSDIICVHTLEDTPSKTRRIMAAADIAAPVMNVATCANVIASHPLTALCDRAGAASLAASLSNVKRRRLQADMWSIRQHVRDLAMLNHGLGRDGRTGVLAADVLQEAVENVEAFLRSFREKAAPNV